MNPEVGAIIAIFMYSFLIVIVFIMRTMKYVLFLITSVIISSFFSYMLYAKTPSIWYGEPDLLLSIGGGFGMGAMISFLLGFLFYLLHQNSNYEVFEKERKSILAKGKLYSQLKIDSVTRGLGQEEDAYHLKGVVDGVSYDIQVTQSEYDYKKRYYEETKK